MTATAMATAPAPTLTPFEAFAASLSGAGLPALPIPWSADAPPSPELFIRWQQFASFLPGFEPPPADDPTAPWNFADVYVEAARQTIARRELFLPYLEPLFDAFRQTGVFALQRLGPDGPPAFLLGDWVLLAPVVQEGASTREVLLPAGDNWIDWHTGQSYPGGQLVIVDAPLERMPIFVRAPVTASQ